MKRGIFLGWPNRIDQSNLSGSGWMGLSSGLSLDNLKIRDQGRPAVSANSTPSFTAGFNAVHQVRAIALAGHNLSVNALWRVTVGAWQSGWVNVWQMPFDNDLFEFSQVNSPLTTSGESLWPYSPFLAVALLPDYVSADAVTVEINDPVIQFIRIGRVFIGGGIQPAIQPTYDGYSEQWDDTGSSIFTADSGAEFFTQRRAARTARFTLPLLDQASEGPDLYEMQRRLGTTGEVLWVPDTSDPVIAQRSGFLGRLRQLSPIEYPFRNTRRAGFEIKEIL